MSELTAKQFISAMVRYSKIQPYCSPDFGDTFVCEFWFDQLGHYSIEKLGAAFKSLVCRNRFPSIEDVRELCEGDGLSDDLVCRDVADRIWQAICKYGSSDWERVLKLIGEVGEVVVGGPSGWKSICDSATYQNSTTLKSQWRLSAKAGLERARKGIQGPAKLPVICEGTKQLIDKTCRGMAQIKDGKKNRDTTVRGPEAT